MMPAGGFLLLFFSFFSFFFFVQLVSAGRGGPVAGETGDGGIQPGPGPGAGAGAALTDTSM